MPLSIIKGQFRIQNSELDGDSVNFHPSDPDAFTILQLGAHLNGPGGTQLRLEAIDALETHYSPRVRGGFLQHQPLALAHAAAATLLQLLGFTDVQRDGERVTSATPEQTEGYILTRFADKYGRAVSFADAGQSDHQDLSSVFVDEELLGQSVNFRLVADGLAYPTYYSKLFPDLRNALTGAATQARSDHRGGVGGRRHHQRRHHHQPRGTERAAGALAQLFRRLIDYLALGAGDISMAGFLAFLASRDDRLFVIPDGHASGLDNITRVEGQSVRLLHPPEELIFIEA